MKHKPATSDPDGLAQFLRPSIHWLLAFIPISLVLERAHVPPPVLFFSAALAIVPIARLIVRSTEHLATYTGDAVGGLLNATFGNAPELIIALVALKAGLLDMVRASIIGAILANLMLATGVAFFLGGLRYHTQEYNAGAARLYSSMMLISAVSLGVPSAFNRFFSPDGTMHEEKIVNLGTAFVLLAAYALYLIFLLKTHPEFFRSAAGTADDHGHGHDGPRWSVGRAVGSLLAASALAAWMSEILVGAAEGTGKALGMSDVFIGIVFLAIIGGAAESGSAIAMGRKNKVDLTIGIAMGSSIQIALFVAPVLVLLSGFIAPAPLELSFSRAEIGTLFLSVLIGAIVAGDGRSNWYKGVQLMLVYAMIAILFYFLPATSR
jgi:Ca2+:H+ antiporter